MRARLLLFAGALPLLALAACASGPPVSVARTAPSRVERALPEADPSARAMPQGPRAISGVERVVVKLEPAPGGGVKVVELLSPDLSDAEKAELVDAIERGELRPDTGPDRIGSNWVTTVVRRRQ
ncbi:MAG TPA: hypothetical protein VFM45_08070 [Anaeromyxobacteraceae bacterium]|nr:hypothetical protein [Anaeromyxobacteraceae bacterium]